MNQWVFFDELKAGTVRNVYFFYGPEAYIRKSAVAALQKKLLMPGFESMNCSMLNNPEAHQIIEHCETLPMLSDYRLTIVQDLALLQSGKAKDEAQESATLCDYLSRVPQTSCLVFDVAAVDKRKKLAQALLKLPGAVAFDALDDAHLAQWMNQTLAPLHKKMDRTACETLAFVSGRDLTLLSGELEKLAAYVGNREQITPEDIEQIATHTAECTVFTMVDALSEGRAREAFTLLNTLIQDGEQRIGILALITRHCRQMMYLRQMQAASMPQGEMAKALGVPPFALTRLAKQAGRRSPDQLRALLDQCVQTDYDIKRGALREDAALDRLMLTMAVTEG